MIFQTALQTHSQYLQMLHALALNGSDSLSATWRNMADFQRQHADLVRELMTAQGRLAAEQWAQSLALWQNTFRAYQDAQEQTLAAGRLSAATQAEDAAEIARRLAQAAHSAPRAAGKRARSIEDAVQSTLEAGRWNGKERRARVLTAYPGVERRVMA